MFKQRYKSHHDAEQCYKKLLDRKPSSSLDLTNYLSSNIIKAKNNAIYLHIPFCDRICSFCNMNRTLLNTEIDDYVQELLKQINAFPSEKSFGDSEINAVYFGGGTPTTMHPNHYENIIDCLKKKFLFSSLCEVTTETTLHNLTDEHLETFSRIGINRISIGIQTFQTDGRLFFNRLFSKEEAIDKLKKIRTKFSGCICIDKIYNYPGETEAMLLDDIAHIIDLEIDSVSFYSLMIHEGSMLSQRINKMQLGEESDKQFHNLFISKMLENNEYELLELTKIARKNKDKYQYMNIRNQNGNTIPFGKGSGGKIDCYSIYNMDFNKQMVAYEEMFFSDAAHKIYGLFQSPIVLKKSIQTSIDLDLDWLDNQMQQLINNKLIIENEKEWCLTIDGIFYGNNIGGYLTKAFLDTKL